MGSRSVGRFDKILPRGYGTPINGNDTVTGLHALGVRGATRQNVTNDGLQRRLLRLRRDSLRLRLRGLLRAVGGAER